MSVQTRQLPAVIRNPNPLIPYDRIRKGERVEIIVEKSRMFTTDLSVFTVYRKLLEDLEMMCSRYSLMLKRSDTDDYTTFTIEPYSRLR